MPRHLGWLLLIEPNDESRAAYDTALRGAGFNVIGVVDCDSARRALATITPRLVIASFDRRTREDCLAFCEQLKGDQRTRSMPILLTSAHVNADDLRRATDISVLGLTVGPHDGTKLAGAVSGVLAVDETNQLRGCVLHEPRITPA
jgi:CheY-like chemotaxis protein